MMARTLAVMLTLCVLTYGAHAYVFVDTSRLTAEMKYWLCGEDGEVSDILLHVMAEQTIREYRHMRNASKAVNCSTFDAAVKAVNAAATSQKWVSPESENGKPLLWTGCANATCIPNNNAVGLTLEPTLYIRSLEFGHEQASNCKDPSAAVDMFVSRLMNLGCDRRVCTIANYTAARPTAAQGCEAVTT